MLEFIEVEEVEEVEENEDVFDIEVEDNHNFFANGLLVHNCQHLVNQHLIEASRRTGAPLVVTCDSHYARPEYWREREIYKTLAWMSSRKSTPDKDLIPKSIEDLKCELYPKNASQVWDSYKTTTQGRGWDFYDDQVIKDAIELTHDIAHNQIGNYEPNTSVKLPSLRRIVGDKRIEELKAKVGSEGETDEEKLAFEDLKQKAIAGLIRRRKQDNKVYIDRLKEELGVIGHLKFVNYFLTYSKVMELLGDKMLLGPGRGSAAGSLLSYVLGITQIDPIQHELLFERFLSRKKKGLPDIDSDVSDRDEANKLLTDFFGQENIVPVSNFTQLQMRSLIKDLCKLEGVPFEEANEYTRVIETEAKNEAKKEPGFDAALWELTYEEAKEKSPTFNSFLEKYPQFDSSIQVLLKEFRGISRHAGGVIITENAFGNMPVIKSGGVLQTPWPEGLNYRHLESLGFLKFDILGLGTLRMIESTVRKILKKEGHKYVTFEMVKQWYYDHLHPDNNKMDDVDVYDHVYWQGNYAGVFQFVNPPVQRFVAEMKPRSITDLAAATSLFRPGPLSIQADQHYLANRRNPKGIRYLHPLLEEVLGDTCGLIVFQEQLQLIYHKLAGVPLEETDDVRKAFTKKEASNREVAAAERDRLREDFATRCLAANNIPNETSYAIFDDMEKYVKYSFNKSHAVSYATVSYQSAWLLKYYPDEWVTSYIDYSTVDKGKIVGKEDPKAIALSEAQNLGYKIGRADINYSEREFAVRGKTLIPSFASVKYCGASVTDEIFKNRPYTTLESLMFTDNGQWKHSKFNKRALGVLVKIGALDSLELVGPGKTFENYKQLHHVVVDGSDSVKRACARKRNNNYQETVDSLVEEAKTMKDWSLREKIDFSREFTGSVDNSLIITPEIEEYLTKSKLRSVDDWSEERPTVWMVVISSQVAKTKSGKNYLKCTIHGSSGEPYTLYAWNFKKGVDNTIPAHTLVISKLDKSDFGFGCWFSNLETIAAVGK